MIYVYDIEVFINCFTITLLDVNTNEIKKFVIYYHNELEINNLEELYIFLKNSVKGMVGFNNLNYDYPILHYILTNYNSIKKLSTYQITLSIYNESSRIINATYSEILEKDTLIPQLDLYRIWHFDNKNKATSLKHVEIAINFSNVEDFPFEPDHILLPNQLEKLLSYNLNDVNATYEFYKITKGQTELKLHKGIDKIQLRKDIKKEYGIKCLNYNDVKIGVAITSKYYSNITKISYYDFKDLRTYRKSIKLSDCISKSKIHKNDYY